MSHVNISACPNRPELIFYFYRNRYHGMSSISFTCEILVLQNQNPQTAILFLWNLRLRIPVHIVQPNLVPPVTTVSAALSYHDRLQKLAPDVTFLMTLYLHPSITPETIAEAKRAGIYGVKAYPAGVTTNSQAGVLDWEQFYPVFAAMEEHDLVLNLHGEVPSIPSADEDISIMNAEPLFLPTLLKVHQRFPKLRIVLEHCTTKKALEAVRSCGPTVAATITAHHLWITIDDVCGDVFNHCKPVAKTQVDRVALVRAVVEGNEKFFFGKSFGLRVVSYSDPFRRKRFRATSN